MAVQTDSEYSFMFFPENRGWSHQLNRVISESHNGGGDFGEIIRAAGRIKVGDSESWFEEWKSLAEHVEGLGRTAEENGKTETASKSFFRASNYYRMADFYLERDDPRELPTYEKHVKLFTRAARQIVPAVEPVLIPFEGKQLHGYFIGQVANAAKRPPCVIIFGGADATCEEVYFSSGVEAAARGLNVLLIDGPGQGYTLRFHKLHARFDYEKTVEAAFDYLTANGSGVDPERIGIMGRSLGGYYAARSAAMEKRVRAAVVFDAIFNVILDVYDFFPPVRRALNWDVGARNEEEAREKLSKFDLAPVASKISCPILIVHGSEDYVSSPKAAEKLYDSITHEDKTLKWYRAGHGATGYRAESSAFVFDWLVEKLA